MESTPSVALLNEIVDRVSVGVLVVNKNYELVLWNTYMENYSQKKSEEVVGKNIFDAFPDLPRAWLEQKIHNVFILKNFSFTSWEHRPYLFKFLHNRPITGGVDYMRQNCTFLPIKGEESGEIEYVCITLLDVTDTSIYEGMLKNAVRSLAEASNRDGLTNIYNRRFLEQSMSKEFARIKRYGGTFSFIIIDLDHFKNINDTYGHLAGDEILKIAAKRIGEHLRTSDILARYGGEEFAVLLPETPLNGADILANRLCQNVAKEPVIYQDQEIKISASLGVSEFQPNLENHEELISRADQVLYFSKENGRNQVTIYDHNNPPIEGAVVESSAEENAEPVDEEELIASTVEQAEEQANVEEVTSSEELVAPEEPPTQDEAKVPEPDTEQDETIIEESAKTEEAPTAEAAPPEESNIVEQEISEEPAIEVAESEESSSEENELSEETVTEEPVIEEASTTEPEINTEIEAEDDTQAIEEESTQANEAETTSEEIIDTNSVEPEPENKMAPVAETLSEKDIGDGLAVEPIAAQTTENDTATEAVAEPDQTPAQEPDQEIAQTHEDRVETEQESVELPAEPQEAEVAPAVVTETVEEKSADDTATTEAETEEQNSAPEIEATESTEEIKVDATPEAPIVGETQQEMTAEEKADLAMIEAYGEEVESEIDNAASPDTESATTAENKVSAEENTDNDSADVIDLEPQEENDEATEKNETDSNTVYVKLGSK